MTISSRSNEQRTEVPEAVVPCPGGRRSLFIEKMGIPLIPVNGADILPAWTTPSRALALITRERSKKWTTGSVVRTVAATIFAACAGLMGSRAVIVGRSRSRGSWCAACFDAGRATAKRR